MSFLFTENHAFDWPVMICMPKAGGHDEITVTGRFETMDDVDFFAPGEDVQSMSASIDLEIARLMEVFKGWKEGDVLDVNSAPLPATPDNIRRFLGSRPARLAVTAAYSEALSPKKGYRAKNSAPPPS